MANVNTLNPSLQLSSDYSLLKIVIVGAGYVGLSNAILLAQDHLRTQVVLFDIDKNKVAQLNQKKNIFTRYRNLQLFNQEKTKPKCCR